MFLDAHDCEIHSIAHLSQRYPEIGLKHLIPPNGENEIITGCSMDCLLTREREIKLLLCRHFSATSIQVEINSG